MDFIKQCAVHARQARTHTHTYTHTGLARTMFINCIRPDFKISLPNLILVISFAIGV